MAFHSTARCAPGAARTRVPVVVVPVFLGALLGSLSAPLLRAQTFFPPPAVHVLSGPGGVSAAGGKTLWIHDITGDGIQDVVSDPQYGYVIAPGRGDGSFGAPILTGVASEIFTTILGVRDVNGDGSVEVFSYHVDNRARWSFFIRTWSAATGSLVVRIAVPPQLQSQSSNPVDRLFVEDLDGDGTTELLQLPARPGPMRIWRFAGRSMIDVTPVPAPTYEGRDAALGDVDGDGRRDLVAYHSTAANPRAVELRLQTAGLGFAAPQLFAFPTPPALCNPCRIVLPRQFAGGDVDGDGLCDFVATGRVGADPASLRTVGWVFFGDRTGTLLPAPPVTPPSMATTVRRLSLCDLDLDGARALVHGARAHRLHPVFAGTGGTIALDPPGTDDATLGDLDGDGDPDLVKVVFPTAPGGGVDFGLSVSLNPTIHSPSCTAPPGGMSPRLRTGTPAPGNAAFAVACSGLAAGTPAVLCLSLAGTPTPLFGCVLGVDLTPGLLLLPSGPVGLVTADASGTATLVLPLRADLQAVPDSWMQWFVLDPAGPGQLPGVPFSLSAGGRLRVW